MSETVVIGSLDSPYDISPREDMDTSTHIRKWNYRAMWSYLRLQYGREIDEQIKAAVEGLPRAERLIKMAEFFEDAVNEQKQAREMQFIVDDSGRHLNVVAVASLKHLLIPPAEVYDMARQIIEKGNMMERYDLKELSGDTWQLRESAGLKIGLQIYGGTITTRFAIKITSWLQVLACLNALSWLGIGNFNRFGIRSNDFERILRIKKREELKPRLEQGIDQAMKRTGLIQQKADRAKGVPMKPRTAKILVSAFALSYKLGAKSIEQVIERFQKEQQNQWGLAMASSWVASHGFFMATPEGRDRYVEQRLSTIAGATLLVDDIPKAEERSLEWLKKHIKQGSVKSVRKLLKDLV